MKRDYPARVQFHLIQAVTYEKKIQPVQACLVMQHVSLILASLTSKASCAIRESSLLLLGMMKMQWGNDDDDTKDGDDVSLESHKINMPVKKKIEVRYKAEYLIYLKNNRILSEDWNKVFENHITFSCTIKELFLKICIYHYINNIPPGLFVL